MHSQSFVLTSAGEPAPFRQFSPLFLLIASASQVFIWKLRASCTGEAQYFVNYPRLLRRSKLRIHRQGHDFGSNFLGHRKISRPMIQRAVRFLKMQRNWILNCSTDPGHLEMAHQTFSILGANYVEVEHSMGPGGFVW